MAVKLVPGAHAYQASAEAAVNAARQAAVPPEEVAQILVAGPQSRFIIGRQRLPDDMMEAIHSLPYFVASAVADKDFSWVHTNPDKFHRPVIVRLIGLVASDPAPPPVHYDWSWGSYSDHRHQVRSQVYEHRPSAERLRAARHRVERCRR